MADEVYCLFPEKPEQCRGAGARGGKTTAHHRRERLKEAGTQATQDDASCAPTGAE